MQLRFTEYGDFLAFNKPFGVRTHRVAENQFGFVEYLNEKLELDLKVVHRLDKETSGLILFAKTKEAAQKLSELFESRKIKKTYFLLTDRRVEQTQFAISSHIAKEGNQFVQFDDRPVNSHTLLTFVEKQGEFNLWKAEPESGKPHQIRLHAQKAGIPILGDREHGGSPHHRLALHAQRVQFTLNGEVRDISVETATFDNLFEDAWNARHGLFDIPSGESFRLCHREYENLRADIFGDRLWVYDYSGAGLSDDVLLQLKRFAEKHHLVPVIRRMLDRGAGVGGKENETLITTSEAPWVAQEEGIKYELRCDSGFSPGLFLDQRENRFWVRREAQDLKVLNLFSYTSGFSVAAALGGAAAVTTVDVSKKFLDWSKENFKLNHLEAEKHEFFAQDSMLFLKGSVKRNRLWDLIVCDPPSFGRSKDSVWKLEQNLPELAKLMWDCLAKDGRILFTCNLERKNKNEIQQLFTKNLKGARYHIEKLPQLSLDIESTDDQNNLMKGFLIRRLN